MSPARTRALLVVVVAALTVGVVGRIARDGAAPTPCATPVVVDDVVVCDAVEGADIGDRAWLFGHKLDLNTASARSLARIRGVGPSLAGRIITHRDAIGGFASVDELDAVDGVGPKMMAKLAGAVEVRPR